MNRSRSPSTVIMTTPTACPSTVATHSAHIDSSGSLSNRTMASRSFCKAPSPARRTCLFDANAGKTPGSRCFSELASTRPTGAGRHVRLVAGKATDILPWPSLIARSRLSRNVRHETPLVTASAGVGPDAVVVVLSLPTRDALTLVRRRALPVPGQPPRSADRRALGPAEAAILPARGATPGRAHDRRECLRASFAVLKDGQPGSRRRGRRSGRGGGRDQRPARGSLRCAQLPLRGPARVGIQYRLSCCRGVIGGLLPRR
jgi:hypothetical protein